MLELAERLANELESGWSSLARVSCRRLAIGRYGLFLPGAGLARAVRLRSGFAAMLSPARQRALRLLVRRLQISETPALRAPAFFRYVRIGAGLYMSHLSVD
jgi:hypothetical protein